MFPIFIKPQTIVLTPLLQTKSLLPGSRQSTQVDELQPISAFILSKLLTIHHKVTLLHSEIIDSSI